MTPVPFDLPVRAGEAALLADLVFQHLEGRKLNEEMRARLATRVAGLDLKSIRPQIDALARDPVHQNTFYLPADGLAGHAPVPLLLHLALASSPASALFPKAILVGRMRPASGREVVVNAVPFGPTDAAPIRAFVERADRVFLPRPLGGQPAITAECPDSARQLPAAFGVFREVLRDTGVNWASVSGPYETCLWAAIRAGWREGYSAAGPLISLAGPADLDALDPSVEDRSGYSHFTVAVAAADSTSSLDLAAALYDRLRRAKNQSGLGRAFDFEASLEAEPAPTSAGQLQSVLRWLKAHARPAQYVAPNPGPLDPASGLESRLAEMAAAARQFNATLSLKLPAGDGLEEIGAAIGRATQGRVHCRIAAGARPEDLAPRVAALAAGLRG